MNLNEFEAHYRSNIDEILNHLQTLTLLAAQLEGNVARIGQDLQNLSQTVEEFINQQNRE